VRAHELDVLVGEEALSAAGVRAPERLHDAARDARVHAGLVGQPAQGVPPRTAERDFDAGGSQPFVVPVGRAAVDARPAQAADEVGALVHRSTKRYDEPA
jgi:hypothetical protein